MENKSSKILVGCGVVFGIVVVLVVLIGFGIYTYIKNASAKKDEIVQLNKFIEDKYGNVDEFIPPKNVVDSVKFVFFLDVRDSLIKYDDEITSELQKISSTVEKQKEDVSFWETLKVMKTALDLIPNFMTYVKKRNELLIKRDLSLGEYLYYYVVSYYSFLKKDVADGPPINILISGSKNNAVIAYNDEGNNKEPEKNKKDLMRKRKIDLSEKINLVFIKFFENAVANADSLSKVRNYFSGELVKMKENVLRLPWQDGLPETAESFIKRFERILEKTYNPAINSLETELIINE
ncbi:MAG: hypothetical protein GXO87_01145 [Chlorobi bacterium]|nr:hypothetical protein [Chlorobiota bacterium]